MIKMQVRRLTFLLFLTGTLVAQNSWAGICGPSSDASSGCTAGTPENSNCEIPGVTHNLRFGICVFEVSNYPELAQSRPADRCVCMGPDYNNSESATSNANSSTASGDFDAK